MNHTCLYSPATQHHHPLAGTHCAYPRRNIGISLRDWGEYQEWYSLQISPINPSEANKWTTIQQNTWQDMIRYANVISMRLVMYLVVSVCLSIGPVCALTVENVVPVTSSIFRICRWSSYMKVIRLRSRSQEQLVGTQLAAVDGYASPCCDLDLWPFDPKT